LRAAFGGVPAGWLPVPLALAWFGVLLAATDLECRRLPNALTLPAYPVMAALLCVTAWYGPGTALGVRAVGGALLFGGAHAVVHLVSPRSLGAGDVKLAGVLGAVLAAVSWSALALGALLAALCTAGYAAVRALPRRRLGHPVRQPSERGLAALDPTLPHGPGLLAAAWLVALCAGAPSPVPGL
jgi:leader peptidase (prepilin peptidase)/N-methyltransferase